MNDLIGSLVVALVVAAVTGCAFVAYNDPQRYRRLFVLLAGAVAEVLIGTTIWNLALSAVFRSVLKSPTIGDKYAEIKILLDAWQTPDWLLFFCLGAVAYLGFLASFPAWLIDEKPPKNVDQGPKDEEHEK